VIGGSSLVIRIDTEITNYESWITKQSQK